MASLSTCHLELFFGGDGNLVKFCYAVDTKPPIMYAVNHVTYNEDTFLIS